MTRITLAPGEAIEITVRVGGRTARGTLTVRTDEHGHLVFEMTTNRTYRGRYVRCELRARWEE